MLLPILLLPGAAGQRFHMLYVSGVQLCAAERGEHVPSNARRDGGLSRWAGIIGGAMAGAVRQWQGLTAAQVQACNGIGTATAEHAVAIDGPPADPVSFLMDYQRTARGVGAVVAWCGGLQAGITWHRPGPGEPKPIGHLWMGQVVLMVQVVPDNRHNLQADEVNDSFMYLLVSEQDAPNYCLWGWARGFDLAAQAPHVLRKDHREFRDMRELRHLGLQSIARMRECGKLAA